MESNQLNSSIFESIYNNFLENSYLYILSYVKNSAVALDIIYKVVEQIFLYDYYVDSLLRLKDKLILYARKQIKDYLQENKTFTDSYDLTIPPKLYLFNFDVFRIFNEVDNQIMISLLIFNYEIKDLVTLIHFDEDYIRQRYKMVLKQIKMLFFDKIKPIMKKVTTNLTL